MDKSVIDKIKEVINQHKNETCERVTAVYVHWWLEIGDKSLITKIDVELEK